MHARMRMTTEGVRSPYKHPYTQGTRRRHEVPAWGAHRHWYAHRHWHWGTRCCDEVPSSGQHTHARRAQQRGPQEHAPTSQGACMGYKRNASACASGYGFTAELVRNTHTRAHTHARTHTHTHTHTETETHTHTHMRAYTCIAAMGALRGMSVCHLPELCVELWCPACQV